MPFSVQIASMLSGSIVGLVLGLIGGGGSVLAVPLLFYFVGVTSPHEAIGTGAVAVTVSALANLVTHARAGNVRWPCALVFAGAGILGAALGSVFGKYFDGQKLLLLFGLLMIAIAASVAFRKPESDECFVPLSQASAREMLPRLVAYGVSVGFLSGFFGIGGGFLIVPGLMNAAHMPMLSAVGTSLVAVAAFGTTTAISYAASGLVNWPAVGYFIVAGVAGGAFGTWLGRKLAQRKAILNRIFAAVVALTGLYVVSRGLTALGWL